MSLRMRGRARAKTPPNPRGRLPPAYYTITSSLYQLHSYNRPTNAPLNALYSPSSNFEHLTYSSPTDHRKTAPPDTETPLRRYTPLVIQGELQLRTRRPVVLRHRLSAALSFTDWPLAGRRNQAVLPVSVSTIASHSSGRQNSPIRTNFATEPMEERHPVRRNQDRPRQAQNPGSLACISARIWFVPYTGENAGAIIPH